MAMIKEVAVRAYQEGMTLVAPNGTTYKLKLDIGDEYVAYLVTHKNGTSHLYHTDSPPFGEDWNILDD